MKREDCTTCQNGQRTGGIIICGVSGRAMTNTSKKCDDYKSLKKQVTFED